MSEPSRRGFLTLASGTLGALLAAIAGVPVVGAVLTPWLKPRAKETGKFIAVANVLELDVGVPKRVDIVASARDAWAVWGDTTIGTAWLIRRADGSVTAYSTVCPHLGCPISLSSADTFRCPCHDSYFKLDGTMTSGPSARGLDALDVQVKDNIVSVRYARFKQGVKGKVEI